MKAWNKEQIAVLFIDISFSRLPLPSIISFIAVYLAVIDLTKSLRYIRSPRRMGSESQRAGQSIADFRRKHQLFEREGFND